MTLIAVVTGIILLEYFFLTLMVGFVRGKTGIQAPATTGDEKLERALRVQMNTLEQIVIVVPAMWIFGQYIRADIAASLGLVFVVGRILYAVGYMVDPKKRAPGFIIGMLATIVLLLGGLYGAIMAAL